MDLFGDFGTGFGEVNPLVKPQGKSMRTVPQAASAPKPGGQAAQRKVNEAPYLPDDPREFFEMPEEERWKKYGKTFFGIINKEAQQAWIDYIRDMNKNRKM